MRQTSDDLLRRIQALEQQLNGVVTDLGGNQIPQTPVVVSGLPAASDTQFPVYATAAAGNVSADGWYARSMSGDATMDDLGVVTFSTVGGLTIYGDGSDGTVNFDGSSTVLGLAPSGTTYTLTRDVYLRGACQVSGSAVLVPSGFRIFCNGTLTIASGAAIQNVGGNASGATAGTAAPAGAGKYGNAATAGGNGGSGTTGSSGTAQTNACIGGAGGSGGASSGGPGTGGANNGGAATAPTVAQGVPRNTDQAMNLTLQNARTSYFEPGAGGGGGNAAASSTGGGGGGGGGFIGIFAREIVNHGTISANGGTGAAASGAGTGAGGGGGGGGGAVILVYDTFTGNAATANGGTGGAAQGAGKNGASGSTGNVYTIASSGGGSGTGSNFTAGGDLAGTSTSQTIEEATATQSQSSAATISFATARVHSLTLGGTVTITLTGAVSGRACGLTLYLIQDGTGSRTVTWPGSVKWPSGTAPTLSTAASSVDIVVLESTDGGTTWYGNLAGKGYA